MFVCCRLPHSTLKSFAEPKFKIPHLRPPDEEALHGKAVWGTIDAADMTRTAFTNFLSYKTGYTACWCPLCFSQECNVLVPLQTFRIRRERSYAHMLVVIQLFLSENFIKQASSSFLCSWTEKGANDRSVFYSIQSQ